MSLWILPRGMRRALRRVLGQAPATDAYVVPWINEGALRTELLLNCWQEPYPRRKEVEVSLTQYAQNGERLMRTRATVPLAGIQVVPLEGRRQATYGICLIEGNTCQQHVQISDGESFAVTHGRTARVYTFVGQGLRARVIQRVDRAYSKNFNPLVTDGYGVELFFFNLSDVPGRVLATLTGTGRRADVGRVAPFGSLRIDPAALPLGMPGPSFRGTIRLTATCPFDYYVLACHGRSGRRRYSLQHVK